MAAETTVLDSLDVRLAKIEGALPYLAAKEDISDLRGELLREMQSENAALRSELIEKIDAQGSELQGEIGTLARKMDVEIGSLRREMHEIRGEVGEISGEVKTLRWSITLSVSLMGLVLGALMFVLR